MISRVPILEMQTDKELSKTMGARFKERRLFKNITQEDLALLSGVNINKIRRFEQQGNIPLLDLIKLLRKIGEREIIFNFMDFEKIIKDEMELDLLMKYEQKNKRKRARKVLNND